MIENKSFLLGNSIVTVIILILHNTASTRY